ncbi:VCBS domain-containing protein [Vibrio tubiashii]|uniref:VCBS domain-containing protein n=1 Tax=Vibrio tubiashii TaxID=29498 RepID=UPI00234F7316|nr:VCBS domain-containing protein [Vibrio tubiashii]WCP68436.1 VCBS domain-containing protein [Vibrio tubiashii]
MGFGTYVAMGNLAANQVIVIDVNGNVRVLVEGELPRPGEVIVQSNSDVVDNNQQLQVELVDDGGEPQDITAEIEDIFAALEEGQDPTQLGEDFATAAGGQSGSSLTASGSVTRDGTETIASTEFTTQGFQSLGLSQTQSLTLLDQFQLFEPIFVDLNNDPLGESLAVTTDEDTAISGTLTATDQNPTDTLTFSQTSTPTNGTAVVNPDGTWTYTPNENYNGPDSFTVIVDDGNGGTDTLVVNVTVTPVNDPATVSDDNGTVVEDDENQTVASGTLEVADVDAGEAFVQPYEITNDYGTFIVNSDGSWTFTINNESSVVQALPNGEEIPLAFDVTSIDGTGTGTVSITVKGTNDSAIITPSDNEDTSVVEVGIDGNGDPIGDTQAGGQLTLKDVDDGEQVYKQPTSLAGEFGTFTFNINTGEWTYTLDPDKSDALNAGDQETDSLTVESFDGTARETITVNIVGSNDGATITPSDNEDTSVVEVGIDGNGDPIGDTQAGGQLTLKDVDDGEQVYKQPTSLAGEFGTFTFNINTGEWTYTLDPDKSDALNAGDQETDSLTVESFDGTARETITVNIVGSNDGATITPSDNEDTSVVEVGIDGNGDPIGDAQAGGQLTLKDVDDGEQVYKQPTSLAGEFGTFTFNINTGEWTYTLDPDKSDALNAGDQETDSLTVESFDGTARETITVNIVGSNDGATITPSDNEDTSVVEVGIDGNGDPIGDAQAGGQLTLKDIDDGEQVYKQPTSLAGEFGTFTFNINTGEWTYTLDPDKSDALNAGDQETDSLTVESFDGTARETITVNIVGSNDGATITPSDNEDTSVVEVGIDGNGDPIGDAQAGGQLTLKDVDDGEQVYKQPTSLAGEFGTFTFNINTGEWTYTLDPDKSDALNAGDQETDSLTVESFDGTARETITVNIVGSNDGATITPSDNEDTSVVEVGIDGNGDPIGDAQAGGQLTLKDVDDGEQVYKQPTSLAGEFGTFTFNINTGEWTYTLDPDKSDALNAGDQETDSLTVESFDGTARETITVNIVGSNDGATITPSDNEDTSVVEVGIDGNGDPIGDAQAGGQLTLKDIDDGEQVYKQPTSLAGEFGTFTFNINTGEWTYTLDPDKSDALNAGDQETDSLTVESFDGTARETITVNIVGSNDGATITPSDNEDTSVVEVGIDGNGDPIGDAQAGGQLTLKDIDDGEQVYKQPTSLAGEFGTFTFNINTGEWTYTLDPDKSDALNAGDQETDSLTVESFDGTARETITVNIVGSNDGATITPSDNEDTSVVEVGIDGNGDPIGDAQAGGQLTLKDIDDGEQVYKQPTSLAGEFGTFTFNINTGEWTYTLDPDKSDALNAGDQETDSLTVESFDGTARETITVNIVGSNDGATITPSDNEDTSVVEVGIDGNGDPIGDAQAGGQLTLKDVDDGEQVYKQPTSLAGEFGTFTFNINTGEWTYTLDPDKSDALNAGDQETDSLTVESFDGTARETITVNIVGSNDGATITPSDNEDTSVVEVGIDGNGDPIGDAQAGGQLTLKDVDDGEQVYKQPTSLAGEFGTFTFNINTGEWTYTLDPDKSDALNAGDQETDSLTVESFDGTARETITVNIVGSNDGATITPSDNEDTSVVEVGIDGNGDPIGDAQAGGQLTLKDVDDGEQVYKQPTSLAGEFGTFTFNINTGEWTYTLDPDKSDALNAGDQETDSLTVESFDGTARETITVNIVGSNDGATITPSDNEDTSVVEVGIDGNGDPIGDAQAGGQLTLKDVDDGEQVYKQPTSLAGEFGTFTFNINTGEWTYTLDPDKSDALNAGDQETDSLTVESFDGTARETITVNIVGSNDGATITPSDNEDTSVVEVGIDGNGDPIGDAQAGGQLTLKDVDDGEQVYKQPTSLAGEFGTFTFNINTGEWTYTLDPDKSDALNAGDQETDSLTVESFDGTARETITVNIVGSNDGATITPSDNEDTSVVEVGIDGNGDPIGDAQAGGQLTLKDVDDGEQVYKQPTSLAGEFGTFTFNINTGEWTYTLDPDKSDALNAGDQEADSLTVESFDGTARETITVNIVGSNDGATITPSDNEDTSVVEVGIDGNGDPIGDAQAGGQLTLKDVDDGEQVYKQPTSLAGEFGTFTFNINTGEWTYTLDPDKSDALNAGDQETDSLTVESFDGTARETITVNIVGSNDGATITPSDNEDTSVVEVGIDGNGDPIGDAQAGGQLTLKDVDDGEQVYKQPTSLAGEFGTFTFNINTGEWTYTLDPDKSDALNAGDQETDSLTVESFDGTARETITVNIVGSNDGATITPSDNEDTSVVEVGIDGNGDPIGDAQAGGQLTLKDVDDGESFFQTPGSLDGQYGTFTFNPTTGHWTYTLDNDKVDMLKVGDQRQDKLVVTSLDGTATETITVNILGTNDGPIAVDDKYNVPQETLLFTESFENMTNTPEWVVLYGDQLGDWKATNGLEIQHESVVNEASDGEYIAELDAHKNTAITTTIDTAGQDSIRLEFDYNPRRDGQSSSDMTFKVGDVLVTVHADGTLSGAEGLNIQIGQPDANGWYRITAELDVKGDNTELTFAGAGKSDSYGALLDNITVTGLDYPNLVTEEDTSITFSFDELLANDTDIDGDDLSIIEGSITSATNGTLTVDYVAKTITFKPDENYNGEATFKYKVTDGNGGEDDATVTLNITPVNDDPVFVDDKDKPLGDDVTISTSTKEDASVSGKVKATDVDGDSLTYTASNPQNGSVTVKPDGSWTYTPKPEYDGPDSFVITVSDGNGGTDTITVNVDVLPVAELTVTSGQPVTEGDEAYLSFEINLDELVSENVGLDLTLGAAGDTATKGIDYEDKIYVKDGQGYKALTPNELANLIIDKGEDSIEVFVKVIDDSLLEGEETVTLKVSSDSQYVEVPGQDTAQGKIVDETITADKETVTVTLKGPSTVVEGDTTTPFTITLSEAVPEKSVITLKYTYTNADNQDIVEVLEVEIEAGSKTANFTIDTVPDNEYEQGQQFNVSVVSVKHDDKNVFEQLDTTSANKDVAIDDSHDNPPESEDFTASVASTGKTQIVFDHTDAAKDHISDDEDDAANKDVRVVITELPDHGTLYYNGVEITKEQLYSGEGDTQYDKFDPDLIEYEPDADSEGFVLGLHSSSDEKPLGEDDQSASREDFYNWGTEVNSTTRELDLGGNDKVIISSNGGALTQYRGDATANHVGHGIGIGAGQGINDGEVLSIDFATRPADSITLGLDGLGGYFEKGLGNSNESSVEITVYFEGGSKTFSYQKESSGNDDLFHELTIPSAGFELPDGAEITRVELTTDGPGNWELRYLETELSDSFDYRAVDSDGNFSDESTVTIADQNAAPVAVNDPEGFSVSLGSLNVNDLGSWQSDDASMSASYQGVTKDITEVGVKRGVGGHENGGIEEQIQFNREDGVSEQLEITLAKPATQFSFEVSNLFKGEGGSGNHEQGKWIAYLDGVVVASDTFVANKGNSNGSYTVDLKGKAFDSIVFESTDFVDVPARGSDSSDYFLTGFEASSESGAYAVNQGGVLEIPVSELLANDSDPDNDAIRITYVFGDKHGEARIENGKVLFDLDDDFFGTTEFKYQITDDNGGFAEAIVKVVVNPEPSPASVEGISLLSSSVDEGQSLAYKVALDGSTLTEARYKVTLTGAQGDTADGDDVDLSKVQFTNGVTYDEAKGEVIVPVGVKDFTILVPTVNDSVHEVDETYTVTIDGKTATGAIIDNDVTIKVHDAPRVNEGEQAVFKVELSEASSDKHYVKFEATTIGYDSETDDIDVDSLVYEYRDTRGDFQTATVVDGYIEIPAGVTELRVSVQTVQDDKFEWTEKFGLHIIATKSEAGSNSSIDEARSDLEGVGSIKLDNADNPTLTLSNATAVLEGDSAVFDANLSKVSEASIDMKVEFVFSAGSDKASLEDLALDSAKPYEGVTVTYLHKGQLKTIEVDETDGTFTLPARVTDFKVIVDTLDDSGLEDSESFEIKLSEVPFESPTDGSLDVIINHGQHGVTAAGTILDNEVAPVITNAAVSVSEEGLIGGIVDDNGLSLDTTDSATITGKLTIRDDNGDLADTVFSNDDGEITIRDTSGNLIESDGTPLTWIVSNDGHTLVGSASGQPIVEVSLDNVGTYNIKLLGQIDHPNTNGEDSLSIDLPVIAKDASGLSSSGKITLSVEDDSPEASRVHHDVAAETKVGANVQLILDVSGSMKWDSVTGSDKNVTKSRLQVMQEAAIEMLKQYDSLGATKVQIVLFNYAASSSVWMTVDEAIAQINDLSASSTTDYDDAIDKAAKSWSTSDNGGKLDGATNVSYFLSDGDPTSSDGDNPNTIEQDELSAWVDHLTENKITAIAYGMGEDVTTAHLDQVAFDGSVKDAAIGGQGDSKSTVVADLTQLPPIMLQSVIEPIEGNLLAGQEGADGADISQLTIDGVTYDFDGETLTVTDNNDSVSHLFDRETNTLTVFIDSKHSLVIDLDDGDYEFFGAQSSQAVNLEFGYTLTDTDGDSSSNVLSFEIKEASGGDNTNTPPTASDFTISSDSNVAQVDFAPHAKDNEDDASSDKHTSVRIEELPGHGKLYQVDSSGKIIGDALEVGSEVLDSANIVYVADKVTSIVHGGSLIGDDFVQDNGLNEKNKDSGVDQLELEGMVISGGKFDGLNFADADATIKYDHNNNQSGVFVHTSHDNGTGKETQIGEYMSISSTEGDISTAKLSFASLQGQFNNGHAKVVAYLFHGGQPVTKVDPLVITGGKSGYATIDSSEGIFDEIRLVVVNTHNAGKDAGFNLSGVELTPSGPVDIKDEFKYTAIDSDDQDSPNQGTVTVNATSIIDAGEGQLDMVTINHAGDKIDWAQSAATIWGSENNGVLEYDASNGLAIDVGIGNDLVHLGDGNDTIYMGDSHSPINQDDITPTKQAAIDEISNNFAEIDIADLVDDNLNDSFAPDEDSSIALKNIVETDDNVSASRPGVDIAHGGGGNDTIYGQGGTDLIFGGTGHDVLDGGEGNDAVRGGSGNDTLIGGLGDDILVGDDGADIFKWVDMATEHDRVTDFDKDQGDKLDLSDLFEDVSKADISELLTELKTTNEGEASAVKVSVSEESGSSTLIIEKDSNTLTIDFDGASATDITNSLVDSLEHLKH